jgi:hypothetical protein
MKRIKTDDNTRIIPKFHLNLTIETADIPNYHNRILACSIAAIISDNLNVHKII